MRSTGHCAIVIEETIGGDTRDGQLVRMPILISPDLLVNQLKRDSIHIANSFDAVAGDDVKEMSQLLAGSSAIILGGLGIQGRKDKQLQSWSGDILVNVANSLSAAVYVLRAGYRLIPGVILRNAVEAMAVCLHGLQRPGDLAQIKSGKFNAPKAINTAKKVIPHFGVLYGFLSEQFTHAGPLHHSIQPLVLYSSRDRDLLVNLRSIRVSVWFHYVVAEFAFIDLVEKPRYWRLEPPDKLMYAPSETERQWQKRFLYGSETVHDRSK